MKKINYTSILCAILFSFGLSSVIMAQYTSIPDANFEQKLIDLGYDTEGTLDGQILTSDGTNSVWSLELANSSITDLTGLNIFTNIATLNVQGNNLTTLDVTSNTLLKWFNCYDNSSLTSLNTTGLALLETINCRGCIIGGTIDVTSSPNLTHLYCYNNQIASLDLSQNSNLVLLHAWTNQLGTGGNNNALNMKNGNNSNMPTADFNISFNWHTLCVDVDNVAYSNTNWTNYQSAHTTYSVDCSILPVEIGEFNVKSHLKSNLLGWKTYSEINNKGFEIEKSVNGYDWTNIGYVEGNGNSVTNESYTFMDNKPFIGDNYYRLKQLDMDGRYEYSDVINAKIEREQQVNLYPNPTSGKVQLSSDQKILNVTITDIVGKRMDVTNIENHQIDLSNLSPGIYNIRIDTEFQSIIKRIIKE